VAINRYEKDLRRPDPDMLVRLAQTLGVTADWLLGIVSPEVVGAAEARTRYLTLTGTPRKDKTRRELLNLLMAAGRNASPERLQALTILAESASRDQKGDPST